MSQSEIQKALERMREMNRLRAEISALKKDFVGLWDAVSEAERVDTNAGDSAVSVVLWSRREQRAKYAA